MFQVFRSGGAKIGIQNIKMVDEVVQSNSESHFGNIREWEVYLLFVFAINLEQVTTLCQHY